MTTTHCMLFVIGLLVAWSTIALAALGLRRVLHDHVARFRLDRVLVLQHLVLAAGWASPIVWWFHRVMCDSRELSCDETVVLRTGAKRSYAHALLLFGGSGRRSMHTTLVALLGHGHTQLTRRIHMLSRASASSSPRPLQLGVTAATLVLLACMGTATTASVLPSASPDAPAVTQRRTITIAAPMIDERTRFGGHPFMHVSSTNETVVSCVGNRSDESTLVAHEVTVNLPENSKLKGVLDGVSIRYAPGTPGRFEITGGSISVHEPSGPRRVVVTPAEPDGILLLTTAVENDEYTFQVTARSRDAQPMAVTVRTSLPGGEGESETNSHLSWYVETPHEDHDQRHRIRLTRHMID